MSSSSYHFNRDRLKNTTIAFITALFLSAPISQAIAQTTSPQKIATIELQDRPTLFSYPLDITDVRVDSNWEYQRSNYRFTLDIPGAAEKPVQKVTFSQIEGADYPTIQRSPHLRLRRRRSQPKTQHLHRRRLGQQNHHRHLRSTHSTRSPNHHCPQRD